MQVCNALLIGALVGVSAVAALQYRRQRALAREHHIRSYVFSASVLNELSKSYPHLDIKDIQLVARALRQFFLVYARAGGRLISMPSKVVDSLWHAFILDTQAYRAFCKSAFGHYLNHVPEGGAMRAADRDQLAISRTWRLACLEENINPLNATRLPLLFAVDSKLNIPEGAIYDPSAFKRPASAGSCYGCGGGGCGGGCGGC